jgi:hypothetical protein
MYKNIIKTTDYNDKSFAHELIGRCDANSVGKFARILFIARLRAQFSPAPSRGRLGWGWDRCCGRLKKGERGDWEEMCVSLIPNGVNFVSGFYVGISKAK